MSDPNETRLEFDANVEAGEAMCHVQNVLARWRDSRAEARKLRADNARLLAMVTALSNDLCRCPMDIRGPDCLRCRARKLLADLSPKVTP